MKHKNCKQKATVKIGNIGNAADLNCVFELVSLLTSLAMVYEPLFFCCRVKRRVRMSAPLPLRTEMRNKEKEPNINVSFYMYVCMCGGLGWAWVSQPREFREFQSNFPIHILGCHLFFRFFSFKGRLMVHSYAHSC